jgi:hypothetical protein
MKNSKKTPELLLTISKRSVYCSVVIGRGGPFTIIEENWQ